MFFNRFILFIFVVNFYGFVLSDDVKEENLDSKAHSDRGGLWFGPRLGKRSMRPATGDGNTQLLLKLLEAAEALKFYYDQLPYEPIAARDEPERGKKVIFTPILGRSLNEIYDKRTENMDFTPRLGRRLSEDMPAMPSDLQGSSSQVTEEDARRKYLTPRLGRMSFSPRLGRDLAYGFYPDKIRTARSVTKNTTT